ncbi:MAG: D-alanyl-D-alanine carboxypeptidase/D-alanyl-D-alanine-endopeptidase [Rhodothermales bacterium]
MKKRIICSILGLVSCVLFVPRQLPAQSSKDARTRLERAINQVLNDDAFLNGWWGVMVVDLHSGEVLYRRNAQHSFVPGSNTKLYSTAAALDLLGPQHRYRTDVFVDGPVVDGVLEGNLIVRGSGDPVIGGRFNNGDLTAVFRDWADSLKTLGITRIAGDLIGDDDVFDDTPLGYGWSWDDEPLWYSAEVSGLSFNDNNIDFTIEGQQEGQPALVRWEPFNTDYVRVINRTMTTSSDSTLVEGYERARGTNVIALSSQVPEGRTDRESLTMTNPTLFFVHVLRESLLQSGVSVSGRPVDVDDLSIKPDYASDRYRHLAVHTSPPLADIVKVLNKRSQNLYAEQLLRTLAAERPLDDETLEPGSAEMGLEVAMETFLAAGIDTSRIQLVDGSGLSRMNLVTPEMTAALLTYLWHHPDQPTRDAFYESLPIGGHDGTLRFRFPSGPARGKVRAKTGTLSNVSSLSGYVLSSGGTPLAFVMMSNHYTVKTKLVRAAQDRVVDLLARYPE